jgi:AcrR family transcriptional regulator
MYRWYLILSVYNGSMSSLEPSTKTGGKRERTRATLIAAALELVAEAGFTAASLDAIAARAGMTKGAIYSNFDSKTDLLLSAASARGLTLRPVDPWAAATFAEGLQALATELAATIHRAKGGAKFAAQFQLYALSDPDLRAGLAATYEHNFAAVAQRLARYGDLKPGLTPRDLAVGLQSVSLGLMMQSFITPDAVTDEVVLGTLKAFAEGLLVGR